MRGQNYRANRALAATDRFMSNVYLDIGAAQLALALLQHPEHGRAMLAGLGGKREQVELVGFLYIPFW